MQAKAASRICWYSTSESVWAGATVIESPVCTPIGSRFSIEQMITQLSARSRITSSSYSFQPAIDSLDEDLADRAGVEAVGGERARTPRASRRCRCRCPPRMYAGRMMTGRPISLDDGDGLVERVGGAASAARRRPISIIASLNCSRSSAVAMASALAPISSGVPGTPIEPALEQLHGQVQRRSGRRASAARRRAARAR